MSSEKKNKKKNLSELGELFSGACDMSQSPTCRRLKRHVADAYDTSSALESLLRFDWSIFLQRHIVARELYLPVMGTTTVYGLQIT
jgi:hypothetical protein